MRMRIRAQRRFLFNSMATRKQLKPNAVKVNVVAPRKLQKLNAAKANAAAATKIINTKKGI